MSEEKYPNERLVPLTTEQAHHYWDGIIAPQLERTLEIAPPFDDIHGIYEDVMSGDGKIFLLMDVETKEVHGVLFCEGMLFRKAKVMNISACAGVEMERWIHLYKAVRLWAAQEGFTHIQFRGRRGWGRALREFVETEFSVYTDNLRDLDGLREPTPGYSAHA